MKTSSIRSAALIVVVAVVCMNIFSSCLKDKDKTTKNYTITGNADGSQVVPATLSGASGTITGTYNSETRVLTFTSTWSGLSAIPTSAGFYRGPVGTAGIATGATWNLGSGAGNSGSYTATVTLSSIEGVELINGGLSYSYITPGFPNGEIRGQITATAQ